MKRRWLSLLLAACVALAPAVTYASDAQHPGGGAETIIISGETTPTDEEPPTEGETAPTDEEPPTEGETTPTDGETTPIEGETAPTDEEPPTEGETTPGEGQVQCTCLFC